MKLYLSENPWQCECLFIYRFQDLLQQYRSIVTDLTNVTCIHTDNEKKHTRAVITFELTNICKSTTQYLIHPLDLLNIVLASLILLIVIKLGYDYYHYRKSGKLPWIVTKMP